MNSLASKNAISVQGVFILINPSQNSLLSLEIDIPFKSIQM